jgi:hypothetical protein
MPEVFFWNVDTIYSVYKPSNVKCNYVPTKEVQLVETDGRSWGPVGVFGNFQAS